MGKKTSKKKIWWLVIALALVVVLNVLLIGGIAGWFSGGGRVVIDREYYCSDEDCEPMLEDVSADEYNKMAEAGKSFVVFVDQGGCHTADRLEGYVESYSDKYKMKIFRIMFSSIKETNFGDKVKFYPSVVVVSKGQPVVYLRADSDEDTQEYNEYDEFEKWMREWVEG